MKNSFDIMAALKYNEPEKMAVTLHTMSATILGLDYILIFYCNDVTCMLVTHMV